MLMAPLQELSGFECGVFKINTLHHWSDSPPDIPLTNLIPAPALAVVIPGRPLHPIQAMARNIIQSLNWQHLAVAFIVAASVLAGVGNRQA